MSRTDDRETTIVSVTSKGQATIPKEFREKLHIDTPGRVQFVETEQGEVVIQPVKRPDEIRGGLVAEGDREQSATAQLREDRKRDRQATEEKFGSSETE